MRRTMAGLLLAASLLVVACNDDGETAPTSTIGGTTTTSTTIAPVDDGILRLGLLAPLSGPGADIGTSMRHAAELAVTRVNESGGVGGRAVRLIIQDEGLDASSAARALDQLVASGSDAVIGPASSTIALGVLGNALDDAVLVCSPVATAIALDQFPDRGLFFRTVPSDLVAAEAMARAIDQTGRGRIGIVHVDDAYGRSFASALSIDLTARGLTVTTAVAYSNADGDFDVEVAELEESGAEVIAVIGDVDLGPDVVDTLLTSSIDEDVPIVVNDALRGAPMAAALVGVDDDQRERVIGVGHRVVTENQSFLDDLRTFRPDSPALFATNVADCVNLISLAATEAGTTIAELFAPRVVGISTGGTSCTTFAECIVLLEGGRNVDYDGASGLLQLGSNGDPTRGVFDVFGFDEVGGEIVLSSLQVTFTG